MLKPGLYRNTIGGELHVIGPAIMQLTPPEERMRNPLARFPFEFLTADIYLAVRDDGVLGSQDYLVTEQAMTEIGYELIEEASDDAA